jgi:hypothetical protein
MKLIERLTIKDSQTDSFSFLVCLLSFFRCLFVCFLTFSNFSLFLEKKTHLLKSLEKLESLFTSSSFLPFIFYFSLIKLSDKDILSSFPSLLSSMKQITEGDALKEAKSLLSASSSASSSSSNKDTKNNKKAKKEEKGKNPSSSSTTAVPFVPPTITKPVISDFDWESAGLVSSLHVIFNAAILASFPQSKEVNLHHAVITRCTNPQFGDFQCNNSLALSKAFKGMNGYSGPVSPKDIAECIILGIPSNPIIDSVSAAVSDYCSPFLEICF